MEIINSVIVSFCLSLDAFVVSITKGVIVKNRILKYMIITGLYFSFFQCLFFTLGFFLGDFFNIIFNNYVNTISSFLFILIGLGMIIDSFKQIRVDNSFSFFIMILSSIAISIDSFTAGISSAICNYNFYIFMFFIYILTFILSFFGILIGFKFGCKNSNLFLFIGGLLLIFYAFI